MHQGFAGRVTTLFFLALISMTTVLHLSSRAEAQAGMAFNVGMSQFMQMGTLGTYGGVDSYGNSFTTLRPQYGYGMGYGMGFNACMWGYYGMGYGFCQPPHPMWTPGGCGMRCPRPRRELNIGSGPEIRRTSESPEPRRSEPPPIERPPVIPEPPAPPPIELPAPKPPIIPIPIAPPFPAPPKPKPVLIEEPSIDLPRPTIPEVPPVDLSKISAPPKPATPVEPPNNQCTNRRTPLCEGCLTNTGPNAPGKVKMLGAAIKPLFYKSELATAARQVMATMYQNCDVLADDNVLCNEEVEGITKGIKEMGRRRDVGKVVSSHPYLAEMCNGSGPLCKEGGYPVCKEPPIFNFGGKPTFKGNVVNPLVKGTGENGKLDPESVGLDCSGKFCTDFAVAGFRFYPVGHQKANEQLFGTHQILAIGDDPKSCLEYANKKYSTEATLQPGDFMVRKGHIFVVESVGLDPYGVKSMGDNCDDKKWDPKTMDFVINQNMPQNGGMGAGRHYARDFLTASRQFGDVNWISEMKAEAIKACHALKGIQPRYTGRSSGAAVLRHKEADTCKREKYKIQYSECVSQCYDR